MLEITRATSLGSCRDGKRIDTPGEAMQCLIHFLNQNTPGDWCVAEFEKATPAGPERIRVKVLLEWRRFHEIKLALNQTQEDTVFFLDSATLMKSGSNSSDSVHRANSVWQENAIVVLRQFLAPGSEHRESDLLLRFFAGGFGAIELMLVRDCNIPDHIGIGEFNRSF